MNAAEIIERIQRLPEAEKEKVRRFARLNLERGQLAGEQLGALAKRMIEMGDPKEADRLEQEIIRGFYGEDHFETADALTKVVTLAAPVFSQKIVERFQAQAWVAVDDQGFQPLTRMAHRTARGSIERFRK